MRVTLWAGYVYNLVRLICRSLSSKKVVEDFWLEEKIIFKTYNKIKQKKYQLSKSGKADKA